MQSALLQFVTPRPAEEPALAEDGRRRRSDASRARIVGALLELTQEGHFEPSADFVAERAGVGRRTVFRHFKDMDSLYGEMQTAILARLQQLVQLPVEGQTWKLRLDRVVELRARIFEEVMPFRDAAEVHRHRSVFLRVEHEQTTHNLREMLLQVLPKDVQADPLKREALDLILSFEAWRRLRREQRLSPLAALSVQRQLINAVIG